MKKCLSLIFALLISSICFVGCEKDKLNPLDVATYLNEGTNIKLYDKAYESEQSLETFIGEDDYLLQRYKYITFNANSKWTYGLTLQRISFDIICNETQTLDFTITISHLKVSDTYDQMGDFYYIQKTFFAECTENKKTPISIDINSEFAKGKAQIAIVLDSSSLEKSETMKYSIANLELFGEHISSNY